MGGRFSGSHTARWRTDWVAVALIEYGYRNGLTFSRMARIFRCSRNTIAYVVRRYVRNIPDTRRQRARLAKANPDA